jgi:hypothetical protein
MDDEDEDFSDPFVSPDITDPPSPDRDSPPAPPIEPGYSFAGYVSIKDGKPLPKPPQKPSTKRVYSILDLSPERRATPPTFREPETLEAMKRLGYVPDDFTETAAFRLDTQNPRIREKVLAELDRRRMKMISNVIAERNRIVNGDPEPPRESDIPKGIGRRRKKKRKKGKKIRRKKRKLAVVEDSGVKELKAVQKNEAKKLSELAQKMRMVDERVKKVKKARLEKVKDLKRERIRKVKGCQEAAEQWEKFRAQQAHEALMKADRVHKNMEAKMKEKMAALRKKAKDREARVRKAAKFRMMVDSWRLGKSVETTGKKRTI